MNTERNLDIVFEYTDVDDVSRLSLLFRTLADPETNVEARLDAKFAYLGAGATRWKQLGGAEAFFSVARARLLEGFGELDPLSTEPRLTLVDVGPGDFLSSAALVDAVLDRNPTMIVDYLGLDISYAVLRLPFDDATSVAHRMAGRIAARGGSTRLVQADVTQLAAALKDRSSSHPSWIVYVGGTIGADDSGAPLKPVARALRGSDRLFVEIQLVEETPRTASEIAVAMLKRVPFYFQPLAYLGFNLADFDFSVKSDVEMGAPGRPLCIASRFYACPKSPVSIVERGGRTIELAVRPIQLFCRRRHFDDAVLWIFEQAGLSVEARRVSFLTDEGPRSVRSALFRGRLAAAEVDGDNALKIDDSRASMSDKHS